VYSLYSLLVYLFTYEDSLSNGASVRLSGKLVDSQGKGQEKELQVQSVHVYGASPEVGTLFNNYSVLTASYSHIRFRSNR
jgi:aspartyl/asparaginyl-tRNA synthetase